MTSSNNERGTGKCVQSHLGSYGYPTRPEEPYAYCPQCGGVMVWACAACNAQVPQEADELTTAQFCRFCGAPYFAAAEAPGPGAAGPTPREPEPAG